MSRRFRIVQVAPLTHQGAYQVQEYKIVKEEIKNISNKYKYISYNFDFTFLGNSPKPLPDDYYTIEPAKWEWVQLKHYMNIGGNYDSYYEAYNSIKYRWDMSEKERIRKEELAKYQATHGKDNVIEYFEFN